MNCLSTSKPATSIGRDFAACESMLQSVNDRSQMAFSATIRHPRHCLGAFLRDDFLTKVIDFERAIGVLIQFSFSSLFGVATFVKSGPARDEASSRRPQITRYWPFSGSEIGRASGRERVCQYV